MCWLACLLYAVYRCAHDAHSVLLLRLTEESHDKQHVHVFSPVTPADAVSLASACQSHPANRSYIIPCLLLVTQLTHRVCNSHAAGFDAWG